MANSLIAVQKGCLDYQAKFFWYKACHLYRTDSNVSSVAWEISDTPGFDDVAIYYDPAIKCRYGYEVKKEYYQVNFHVAHTNAFTYAALIDPLFIGAVSESLLQKLYHNYKIIADRICDSTLSYCEYLGH